MTRQPSTSAEREAIVKRGDELYEHKIAPILAEVEPRHFVVVDVLSGAYEVDADEIVATDRLYARKPNALVYLRRAGSRFARRLGRRMDDEPT